MRREDQAAAVKLEWDWTPKHRRTYHPDTSHCSCPLSGGWPGAVHRRKAGRSPVSADATVAPGGNFRCALSPGHV